MYILEKTNENQRSTPRTFLHPSLPFHCHRHRYRRRRHCSRRNRRSHCHSFRHCLCRIPVINLVVATY